VAFTILMSLAGVLAGCGPESDPAAPQIDSLAPADGAPGTTVLLQGARFGASKGSVAFQDKDLSYVDAQVVTWTDTAIVVTAPTMPSGAPQTVNVGLQTAAGLVPPAPATFNVTKTGS
jgi:hypothetical protein